MNKGRVDDDSGRIAAARFDYDGDGLAEEQLLATPYAQARRWVDDAVARSQVEKDVFEPLAMSVATVDAAGVPNVRTVLMRFLDERGPGFVTALTSAKGREIAANPVMAVALTWPPMYRACWMGRERWYR